MQGKQGRWVLEFYNRLRKDSKEGGGKKGDNALLRDPGNRQMWGEKITGLETGKGCHGGAELTLIKPLQRTQSVAFKANSS